MASGGGEDDRDEEDYTEEVGASRGGAAGESAEDGQVIGDVSVKLPKGAWSHNFRVIRNL